MPSWCASNFLFQSLLIFIIYFIQIILTNDSHHHHQVLKVDVGQDIIMSCLFDENKIEQVRRNLGRIRYPEKIVDRLLFFSINKSLCIFIQMSMSVSISYFILYTIEAILIVIHLGVNDNFFFNQLDSICP